ncbi:DEAD/DEAH box helicase [Bacillus sp. B15-48]|nr:DEAD/DEAH box helicase [Bacillus sp. B15-48]
MKGKDIIAQAQTGTGKTFAFILPILEKMEQNLSSVQALIITPTRELALQITNEVKKLINDKEGIDVLAVYGGQDVEKQLKKLNQNVQIVVGTPGRLLDHIERNTLQLSRLSFLVLDEADQMLHIGFLDEVERIIHETPVHRQTMLFSATMPREISMLARKHMRNPEYIQVEKIHGPAENVNQIAIQTVDRAKQDTLVQLINMHRPFLAVIFCRTKRRVSKLYTALKANGFSCDELHGDLSQAKREQVMKRFRDAEFQLLIATDVAARGLDVEGVTHVFNYDIPLDSESYVHRIGRTGRAGMKGLAITLYSPKDRSALDEIEAELNIQLDKTNLGNGRLDEKTEKISEKPKQKTTDKSFRHRKQSTSKTLKENQGNNKESNKKSDGKSKSGQFDKFEKEKNQRQDQKNRKQVTSKRNSSKQEQGNVRIKQRGRK